MRGHLLLLSLWDAPVVQAWVGHHADGHLVINTMMDWYHSQWQVAYTVVSTRIRCGVDISAAVLVAYEHNANIYHSKKRCGSTHMWAELTYPIPMQVASITDIPAAGKLPRLHPNPSRQ